MSWLSRNARGINYWRSSNWNSAILPTGLFHHGFKQKILTFGRNLKKSILKNWYFDAWEMPKVDLSAKKFSVIQTQYSAWPPVGEHPFRIKSTAFYLRSFLKRPINIVLFFVGLLTEQEPQQHLLAEIFCGHRIVFAITTCWSASIKVRSKKSTS